MKDLFGPNFEDLTIQSEIIPFGDGCALVFVITRKRSATTTIYSLYDLIGRFFCFSLIAAHYESEFLSRINPIGCNRLVLETYILQLNCTEFANTNPSSYQSYFFSNINAKWAEMNRNEQIKKYRYWDRGNERRCTLFSLKAIIKDVLLDRIMLEPTGFCLGSSGKGLSF